MGWVSPGARTVFKWPRKKVTHRRILQAHIEAEKVTLWNLESAPLLALWIKNTSGQVLDAGSFNVLEADTFAEAKIMASEQPGTDGGASADGQTDAGGSGGSATSGGGGAAGAGGTTGSGGATIPTGSGGAPAPGTGGSGATGTGVTVSSGCAIAGGDQAGAELAVLLMLAAIARARRRALALSLR